MTTNEFLHTNDFIKPKQLCDWLRIHPTTMYRLRYKKLIPFVHINRVYRFSVNDIIQWMLQGGTDAYTK